MAIKSKLVNDWYRGVPRDDKEAKEARLAEIRAAEPAFRVLQDIIERDLNAKRKAQTAKEDYDLASWPYKQADYNGSIRQLEKMLNILPIES